MLDLDRESIIQSSDFLSVLSELSNTSVPNLDEVLKGAEHFRKFFSSNHEEDLNDFSLHHTKNYLFECINRGDLEVKDVFIPSKTYLSVPQSIMQAGGDVIFNERENDWSGIYQLKPYPIYDSAKRLTSNMYIPGSYMCLSFHIKKTLKIGKGGMVLTDDENFVDWFRRARYEGRGWKTFYKDDNIKSMGWNMYMTPQEAAHGLCLLQNYPLNVPDQMEDNGYLDLRQFELFSECPSI